jgi:hypothetical protein
MSSGGNLTTYNSELVKCIEDLREQREELNRGILKDEEEKAKIQKVRCKSKTRVFIMFSYSYLFILLLGLLLVLASNQARSRPLFPAFQIRCLPNRTSLS